MDGTEPVRSNKFLIIGAVIIVAAAALIPFALKYKAQSAHMVKQNASVNAFNTNDFAAAAREADDLLARDPRDVSALLAKAAALAQEASLTFKEQELGEQAAVLARQALEIDPKNDEAWRILGYTFEIRQKYSEAHKDYVSAFTLNPKNAKAFSQDGHAYDLEGNFSKAAEQYQKALSIDPSLDQAQMGLARILLRGGDIKGALNLYKRVLVSSPNLHVRAEAAYSASSLESALGSRGEARELAKQATVLDPAYALGWVGYGKEVFLDAVSTSTPRTVEQRNELISGSFNSIAKAIQLNPNQSVAHLQLASQLAAVGQNKEAKMVLKNIKKIVPNDISLSAPDKQLLLRQAEAVEKLIK